MRTAIILSALAVLAATSPIGAPKRLVVRDPPLSDGVSILDTINKYRDLYGLNEFTWNDDLASQAQDCGDQDGGVNEVHCPPTGFGAWGQVIAPGPQNDIAGESMQGFTPFEATYVAGWLCEVATDPEIVNICPAAQKVINFEYDGTGHHDILTSSTYNQAGCAFAANPAVSTTSMFQGLWVCNVAA